MSIGIYKYQNKINGHIYIGQSTNIERRYQQHIYDANNPERRGTGLEIAGKVPDTKEPAHWIELS